MGILTESKIRLELRNKNLEETKTYFVEEGTIVTPSAKSYLSDHKITLIIGENAKENKGNKENNQDELLKSEPKKEDRSYLPEFKAPKQYESIYGGHYDKKPEHMTSLHGMKLVNKDHPKICFRGKIDSFIANIVKSQFVLYNLGYQKAANDLEEVVAYVREILRSEVLNIDFEDTLLLGMDSDEIRARSHRPKEYYGINHFAPSFSHGEAVAQLNILRTLVREVELSAYNAFKDENGIPTRNDIIQALNRLSSLFYVMMFMVLTKDVKN